MKKTLNFENWIKDKLGKNFTFSIKLLNCIEDITCAPFDTYEEVIKFNSTDMYPDNYLYFGGEILSLLSPAEFEDLNSLWQEEIGIARDNGSDIVFGFKDKISKFSSRQLELGDIITMNTRDYVITGVYLKDNEITYRILDKETEIQSLIKDEDLRNINFVNSGSLQLEFSLKRQELPIYLRSSDRSGPTRTIIEKTIDINGVLYRTSDALNVTDEFIENILGDWCIKEHKVNKSNRDKTVIKNDLFYGLKDAFKDEKVICDLFDDLFKPKDCVSTKVDNENKQQKTSEASEKNHTNYDMQNMYVTEIIDLTPKNKADKSFGNVIVLGTTVILNNTEYVCTGIKAGFANILYYTLKDKYGMCQDFNEQFLLMRFSNGELRIENTVPKIEEVIIPLTIGKDDIRSKFLNSDNKPIYVGQSREYTLEEINNFLGETNKQKSTTEEIQDKQILKVFDILELPMGTYTCSSISLEKDVIIYRLDSHEYENEFLTPFSKDTLEAINYEVSVKSIYNQRQIGDYFTINGERKRIVEINKDFTYKADDDSYYGFDEIHSIGLEDSLCLEKLTIDNVSIARRILKVDVPIIIDKFSCDNNTIYTFDNDYTYDNCYILEYKDR